MPYKPFANQEFRNILQARLELRALLSCFPVLHHSRILEIGCGRGNGLVSLGQMCDRAQLVGIDISEDAIATARHRILASQSSAQVLVADIHKLPFCSGSFDVVLDFGTCYHIDSPEVALSEISRVLAVGGGFIAESPFAQRMSHPFRATGKSLPWHHVAALSKPQRHLLWEMTTKATAR